MHRRISKISRSASSCRLTHPVLTSTAQGITKRSKMAKLLKVGPATCHNRHICFYDLQQKFTLKSPTLKCIQDFCDKKYPLLVIRYCIHPCQSGFAINVGTLYQTPIRIALARMVTVYESCDEAEGIVYLCCMCLHNCHGPAACSWLATQEV